MMYNKYKQESKITDKDILGPFYRPGSPFRTNLVDYPTLILTGTLKYTDGSLLPQNTYIDFWQADDRGHYDEEGSSFRGIQQVKDGNYILKTVKPGYYDISDPNDPQPHEYRCSHIHVKIWVNGIDILTTQLYFDDSEYDDSDHWFAKDRCVKFVDNNKTKATFDFVIKLPDHG